MKDYEAQLEGLLGVFLQDFRETDSTKLELDKTMIVKLFQDDELKDKVKRLDQMKDEKINPIVSQIESLQKQIMEKQELLNTEIVNYWETFLSLIIKQNEQL